MVRYAALLACTCLLFAPLSSVAGTQAGTTPSSDPYASETKAQRDARMSWWREARFGMFIHWGVYSVPAGTYHGRQIGGIGEWIMNTAKIPCAEYQGYAKQFNPVKFNADEWVRLAKGAGMKYIVITSKHHDGFAMFDSKASDWNIVKRTPFHRDPLKELAAACRKHGIRLGFYYSQAQDWNNPGGAAAGGHWDKAQDGDMTEYIRRVAAPQVREILTKYGPGIPAVLWWDTPVDMTKERADLLIPLLKLRPGIIHNNRLGIYRGDTETPEQFVPATGYPGRDWETCMTMNDTWGYKSYDHNWKSPETLVRTLVDIASKGGNYLLNVGPTNEGLIPGPSQERLRAVGEWMKVNSPAIYATTASPFKRLPWGRCTKRVGDSGTTLYLHVFDWPADGRLLVPGLRSDIGGAALLGTRLSLQTETTAEGVVVRVPQRGLSPISTTIVLQTLGPLNVEEPGVAVLPDGSVRLPASEATVHGSQAQYESGPERDNIGFWLDPADWVEWQFQGAGASTYAVTAEIASPGGGASFEVSVGGRTLHGKAPATGDYGKFETVALGSVELAAGKVSVAVRPVADGWSPINLKSVTLRPVR